MPEHRLARTVLIVEDQRVMARLATLFQERSGFAVVCAATGDEALAVIEGNSAIDVVLMDIDLGAGVSGFDLAQELGRRRSLPIVFHSATASRDLMARARRISRYGYVHKCGRHYALVGEMVDLVLATQQVFELYSLTDTFRENRLTYGEQALVVCALCDPELAYTWINDPHPDFVLDDVIDRTDVQIRSNEGTEQLAALKRQVLLSGRKARRDIRFPLSSGKVTYHVTAAPMLGKNEEIVVVKTLSFVI